MSLRKQLVLTAIGLVLVTLAASAVVMLWSNAQLQLERDAVLMAANAAQIRDAALLHRLADGVVADGNAQTFRLVDTALNTLVLSGEGDAQLSEVDRAEARTAFDQRQAHAYHDLGLPKVAAPLLDETGQPFGALLISFRSDRVQTLIQRQVQAAAPLILIVLVGSVALAYFYLTLLMRPVARLDAAVSALGSYRFKPDSLDDLAKRSNELGRVAKLLQRMANAEQGWRRSLEGLRLAKEELEQRVDERTRDLRVALEQQTELNNQLQVVGAGLGQSIQQLTALAEVSQAINSTRDSQKLLATIVSYAVRLSKSDGGTIYEFDETRSTFVVRANDGLGPELAAILQARQLGESTIVDRAVMERQPTQVADLWEALGSSDVSGEELGFRSLLAVPLLKDGSPIGGLVVRRKEPGDFEPETIRLLQTIALQSVLVVSPQNVAPQSRQALATRSVPASHRLEGGALPRGRRELAAGSLRGEQLRKERLSVIRGNEGPVDLPPSPKIVVHVTPLSSFDPTSHFDIVPVVQFLAPLGRPFTSQAVNFDGVVTCEQNGGRNTAYAQGFWNGRIEIVDALLLSPRSDGRRQIPTRALEDSLIRTLDLCKLYYEQLEVPPPYVLGLTLLGVRGYRLAVDEWLWSEMTNHPIERADLVFPEIVIDDLATPSVASWRPLFDLLWNACGFSRCLDYDAHGGLRPHSKVSLAERNAGTDPDGWRG
jgi:hypothetical protein